MKDITNETIRELKLQRGIEEREILEVMDAYRYLTQKGRYDEARIMARQLPWMQDTLNEINAEITDLESLFDIFRYDLDQFVSQLVDENTELGDSEIRGILLELLSNPN